MFVSRRKDVFVSRRKMCLFPAEVAEEQRAQRKESNTIKSLTRFKYICIGVKNLFVLKIMITESINVIINIIQNNKLIY